ncbi:MAG: PKD domain-containing protein, partial [Calditrichaeota bacterium]
FGPPYTWLYAFKPAGSPLQTSAGTKSLPVEKGNRQNLGELRWAYIGDMGFYFPGPFYISAEGLGNGYTKLILDHGRSIDREKAAVVILPGAQAAEAENYRGIEILKQDSQAHIVRDRSSNVLGAAFFSGAETQYVGVNLPAYLMYKTGANQFHFTLYNPHKEQAIPVRLSHEGNPTNPMADASIDPARATHQLYQVKLPFRLQKSSGEGMALFDLQPLDNNWTLLSVNLRVYRKFELRGQKNADGSYSLDRAFIALNDAAVPEEAAPYEPVDAKPVAVPNVPGNATVGKSIMFDGSASYDPDGGAIQQYTWEFGDGATSHGQKVLHAYAREGRFQGTLKVRDDQGNEDTAAFSVRVTAPVDSSTSLVVKISADDRYELYVNGERLGSGSGWETAEAYTAQLRKGKNVIAVKALNSGSAAALLAEIHAGQQQFFSNTQWKISRTMQPGWEKVDFDDRSWVPAFSYGAHGTAQPWAQFTNVQGIAIQKPQWIWSKYKSDPVVYFRFAIGEPQDRQPPAAPTGLSTRIGN